jgi:alanyl-tRNA synthetase
VAAGVRRIEAIVAEEAENYFRNREKELHSVKELLKNPKDVVKSVEQLLEENAELRKKLDGQTQEKAQHIKQALLGRVRHHNGMKLIAEKIELPSADAIKNISFELKNQLGNAFVCLGAEIDGKAHLSIIISDDLVKEKKLDASKLIRELSKEIQGGGGGQAFYATAGGKNPDGITKALEKLDTLLS